MGETSKTTALEEDDFAATASGMSQACRLLPNRSVSAVPVLSGRDRDSEALSDDPFTWSKPFCSVRALQESGRDKSQRDISENRAARALDRKLTFSASQPATCFRESMQAKLAFFSLSFLYFYSLAFEKSARLFAAVC